MSNLTGVLLDGRYEIGAILARGGMATVYSALDTRLDRPVAVKVMHSHLARDEDFVARFIREAKSAASLTHPNIVAVHDQGWNQGGPPAVFLVMEFVDGPTLRQVIRDRAPLDPAAALDIMEAILSALGAAHRAGIVHRDVKPENVILARDGRVKVADFGLARALTSSSSVPADSGGLLGTVAYLAPEQVQRGIADARSDVYAAGIVLYEMLTGAQPFVGETPIQVAFRHVHDKVPAPSSVRWNIPASIDALVAHATEVDPDLRPKDANEFFRDVQSAQATLGSRESHHQESEQPKVMAKKVAQSSSKNRKRKASKKTRPSVRRAMFVAAAVLLGIAGWYVAIGPASGVSVPSVAGMTTKDAGARLTKVGLEMTIGSQVYSSLIPAGVVISSQPAGGGHLASGGTVKVVVSKGLETYVVPPLVSLTVAEAESVLTPTHLTLNQQNQVFSDTIPKGYIISIDPQAGTQVSRDTIINATISKGVAPVALASYVGKSSDQALSELAAAGLKPTSKMRYSDTVAAGIVISQKPAGGTNQDTGTIVTLIVSKGPQNVTVPNVIGQLSADAGKALEDAGLTFKINLLSTHGTGKVVGQSIPGGTVTKVGSLVTLDVY
ncbi:MAG TPA: Stk1 family PASTA domain-containing Ser/Thr kinase [Candidatus Nanopelagicaceae bacterium]|nr:Stk1 family PASTA domain-containing Ser/Thr kinase [Candidatus Nanopelagicaceae bacterium]